MVLKCIIYYWTDIKYLKVFVAVCWLPDTWAAVDFQDSMFCSHFFVMCKISEFSMVALRKGILL